MLFAELGLSPEILRAINEFGYSETTPIQAEAIPKILGNHDLLAAAQTGTGKTAAFMLPILERLKNFASTSTSPAMHPVRALILTPTRELADQISTNVKAYARYLPLRHAVIFGGVYMGPQTQELRRGVEIIVATPGRLLDHIGQKSVYLNKVEMLVLDEADRMLDMGFINDIRKIMELLPKTRQTLLFSATFSPEIKKLSEDFMRSPVLIEVAQRNAAADQVEQIVYAVDSRRKRFLLEHLIKRHEMTQVIVFCKTKQSVDQVARELKRSELAAEAIHGDKTQSVRLEIMNAFKAGELRILVATDVAARGLDITELPYVINYELPNAPEDYVHRIGRTGRAGASGVAISLMAEEEKRQLDGIAHLTQQQLTPQPLEGFWPSWMDRPREAKPEPARRAERSTIAPRTSGSSSSALGGGGVLEGVEFPLIPGRQKRKKNQREIPALLLPPRYR